MFDISKSQGTRRFIAYCIALAILTLIGVIAFKVSASPDVTEAVMWPITFLTAGYLGFGTLHDTVVRKGMVTAAQALVQPKDGEK